MNPHPPLELLGRTHRTPAHGQPLAPHQAWLHDLARVHDLARQHALALRREARARFWQQLFGALEHQALAAAQGAQALWAGMLRTATRRPLRLHRTPEL